MMKRFGLTLLAAAVLSGPATLSLAGSAPANDNFANATTIVSLPFTDTVDLSLASTEPGEDVTDCYSSTQTVWYRFTAPVDEILDVSIVGSDSDVGMRVYYDYGSGPVLGNCLSSAYPTIQISVAPTLTLYFQLTSPAASTGVASFSSEPLLTVSATVNAAGTIDSATGETVLTGTVTCDKAAWAGVALTVYQRQGRRVVASQGGTLGSVACSTAAASWTGRVAAGMVPGSATVNWIAYATTSSSLTEFAQSQGGPTALKIKTR
jgi:hypothetical protein